MDHTHSDLADFLGRHAPFDALDADVLEELARAATARDYQRGELVLDAFRQRDDAVYVVVTGQVNLWFDASFDAEPDEVRDPGGVVGFSAMLTQRSVGPRVVAATDARLIRLPGAAAARVFTSRRGAEYLAENSVSVRKMPQRPTYVSVDDLVVEPPLLVSPDTPISDVARLMSRRHLPCAVVELPQNQYGLVTDASLRQHVVIDGVPPSSPASKVIDPHPPSVTAGDSAAEALVKMFDCGSEVLLVTDPGGRPVGAVSVRDFALSPVTADVSLHERLRHAGDTDKLTALARRIPALLDDLLGRGLGSDKVIAVYSSMVDAVMRRAIGLVFAARPELPLDAFTWLSLGSNGRREAVLSSDVDSAVVFVGSVDAATATAYRAAFGRVGDVLASAGLSSDDHGATAWRPEFSRTEREWHDAASEWVAAPERNQGAMMTSLLVDGRPIFGDRGLRGVSSVFRGVRERPETMRMLLEESLSKRPKGPKRVTTADVLLRRTERIDLKAHALLPVVNIARWAALSVGSPALTTPDRLRSAAGSAMLPDELASSLLEAFEVIQRLRLRYQLIQVDDGRTPSDRLIVRDMTSIDRSLIGQAVREIAAAQRRMANVSAYVQADQWSLPQAPS